MGSIDEDDTGNTGTLIADILGNSVSDADVIPVEGIAIIAVDNNNGNWQCYVDNAWWSIAPVSANQAQLLQSDVPIRFVPSSDWNGTATLTYRAWDRTTGSNRTKVDVRVNGGSTAFSSTEETASITVNSINDPPVITDASGGQALHFDGSNDYVHLSDTDMNASFTYETWLKAEAANNWSRFFDFGNGEPNYNIWSGFNGALGQTALEVFVSPGNTQMSKYTIITSEELPLNQWIHVAAVYDEKSKTGYIYWNGLLKASGPMDLSQDPDTVRANNYIARSNWAQDDYFKGSMQDIRIWSVARTQTQIQSNMNSKLNGNEAGLVVYYPVDEGTGTVLNDLSVSNDGNIEGAAWIKTTGITGNMRIPWERWHLR